MTSAAGCTSQNPVEIVGADSVPVVAKAMVQSRQVHRALLRAAQQAETPVPMSGLGPVAALADAVQPASHGLFVQFLTAQDVGPLQEVL